MKPWWNLMLAAMIILVRLPESTAAFSVDDISAIQKNNNSNVLIPEEKSTATNSLASAASDAVQNKAYAHLEIDSGNVAHIYAGFTHPDGLIEDVQIEWDLYGWNIGTAPEAMTRIGVTHYVTGTSPFSIVDFIVEVPTFDYYLLACKNKIKETGSGFVRQFISESRWGRIAPYNGIWERTGEVTSYSAVLQTYLTEKPAFNATEETNLRVPPMAGYAQFIVYRDSALTDKVSESGFYPVDDYIQVGTEWRRTNYNFRWTVTGLEPGTTYYYAVETKSSDGLQTRQATNVNSFRTPPLADANQPTTFVVAHCYDVYHTAYPDEPQYEDLGLKIFASMLSDPPPDFIIMQGDTVFYDGGTGYAPDVGTYAYDRYLWRWLFWPAQYQFTNFMNFFQQVPGYWQVDDHDYWANNVNAYNPEGWLIFRNASPTPGDYGSVGENAVEYYTSNPYLTSDGDGNQYWRSIRWGQHLEIFLEEGRNLRDYDAGLIWGVEQRQWLEQHIRESDATFKIISATTPMIGPVEDDSDPSWVPDKHANDHFRAETELFLNNIRDIKNVFLVAGDRHHKYHSVVNSANYPELSNFHEFSSGAGAGPPHAIPGGVPNSDLAVMIYSDDEVGASAGYLRVEIVLIEDGAQITFKLIRVTEELDNDVVHQQTFTVNFDEPAPVNIYLPFVVKSE